MGPVSAILLAFALGLLAVTSTLPVGGRSTVPPFGGNAPTGLPAHAATLPAPSGRLVPESVRAGAAGADLFSGPSFTKVHGIRASIAPPAEVLATLNLLNGSLSGGVALPENGSYPQAAVVDTSNGHLFVATGGGAVVVVDTATNRILDSIPTGSAVAHVAYDSANGELYATQFGLGQVSVINGTTDQIVATLPVGKQPRGITFDPVNGDLYVMNRGSNNVSVIDGHTANMAGSMRSAGGRSTPQWILRTTTCLLSTMTALRSAS
jgi:YVTN family beta-propeller protein